MTSPPVPPALRDAVQRDLRRVVPLPRPMVRALWLGPWALVLLLAAEAAFGLRRDAPALGLLLTWGASSLQMVLGLLLCAAALREAVPGRTLTRRLAGAAFATTMLVVVTVTWLTWMASPSMVPARVSGFVWRVCVTGTILTALPVLAVAGVMVERAFPLRPRLAGALYGLGAGLMADAGWRLFCHYSAPAHVFGAHLAAVAGVTLAGVALATALRRR